MILQWYLKEIIKRHLSDAEVLMYNGCKCRIENHMHKIFAYQVAIKPCINRNTRPNNNQLIIYYLRVRYLLRIPQNPVNNTYNISVDNFTLSIWITFFG